MRNLLLALIVAALASTALLGCRAGAEIDHAQTPVAVPQ